MGCAYTSLTIKQEGTIDGMLAILKWTSEEQGMEVWSGFIWLMVGPKGFSLPTE
jgi:hypothetical protein